MLRTLRPVVTDVGQVNTHCGSPTAIKTRTPVGVTPCFVLTAWTVADPVAADKDGQAVVLVGTPEVRLRTHCPYAFVPRLQGCYVYFSCSLKLHDDRKMCRWSVLHAAVSTSVFVIPVHTVFYDVTPRRLGNTLQPGMTVYSMQRAQLQISSIYFNSGRKSCQQRNTQRKNNGKH